MFFEIPKGTKLILSGNGISMDKYKELIDTCFMDYQFAGIADTIAFNNKEYLRGLSIVPYDSWESLEGMLVIYGDEWYEKSEKLHQEGYVLLRDYIPEWFFEIGYKETCLSYNKLCQMVGKDDIEKYIRYISYAKPIAAIYGDEQVPCLMRVLSRTKELTDDYVLLSLLPVDVMKKKNREIPECILKKIRLLFVQENESFSGNYCTEVIKSKLRKNCKIITFPHYEFKEFFEMVVDEDSSYIELKEVISNILEKNNDDLQQNEEGCDVKIREWIMENFSKARMFEDRTHPGLELWKKVIRESMEILGYKKTTINSKDIDLGIDEQVTVDDKVKKILNLKWG